MTFVFPSINGTVKPRERSGHIAAHFDGYLVIWGGYYKVSLRVNGRCCRLPVSKDEMSADD